MDRAFREAYHKAYDEIFPDKCSIERILARAAKEESADRGQGIYTKTVYTGRRRQRSVSQAAVILLLVCGLSMISLPVLAAHVPAVYRVLEKYVPNLANYAVPEERECVNQGIIMRVEGIRLEGKNAQIIVSFGNQAGFRRIKGKVDLYDSYGLISHTGRNRISGCHFLTYDEEEEKAYFQIEMTADQDFDREKLSFYVRELLTEIGKETKDIDLSGIVYDMDTKEADLRGSGGDPDVQEKLWDKYYKEGSREFCRVLDGLPAEECAADDFTLTAVAYMDGALHVQMCMGDVTASDRHVQTVLVDASGVERHGDGSVSWFERAGDIQYTFYEYAFLIDEDELKDAGMYGIFHSAQESVKGNWKVTFRLD